jgi:hypothetical protein
MTTHTWKHVCTEKVYLWIKFIILTRNMWKKMNVRKHEIYCIFLLLEVTSLHSASSLLLCSPFMPSISGTLSSQILSFIFMMRTCHFLTLKWGAHHPFEKIQYWFLLIWPHCAKWKHLKENFMNPRVKNEHSNQGQEVLILDLMMKIRGLHMPSM